MLNKSRVAISTYMLGKSSGGPETYDKCLISALMERSRKENMEIVPFLARAKGLAHLPLHLHSRCRFTRPSGKAGVFLHSGAAFRKMGARVVHATYVLPPFLGKRRVVGTVHDVGFLRRPEFFPRGVRARLRWNLSCMLRRCDVICTVSGTAREDLLDATGVEDSRVVSVRNGLDPSFLSGFSREKVREVFRALGLDAPYVLYAGRLEARKNVEGVVAAYNALRKTGKRLVKLVLLGNPRGYLWRKSQDVINRSPYFRDIIQTGHVDSYLLPAIYEGASVFICLSLHEGFGFPVLEAMARGVPVVCSNTTSLPEVAGDAAYLVDPLDPHEAAHAVARIMDDDFLRSRMIQKGRDRPGLFSWDKAAGKLLGIYNSLA